MSTICKLEPEVRRRRGMRAAFLRTPCGIQSARIMATLHRTHRASHLTGDEKHTIFEVGANLMNKLNFR